MGSGSTTAKNRGGRAGFADASASSSNGAGAGSSDDDGHSASLEAGYSADSCADSQAGVGRPRGVESLGMVGGPDDLIAQAEAVAAEIPSIDPATGQAAPLETVNVNGQWAALTPPAVEVLSAVVFPAWEIQTSEQRPVSEALAECLEQVFPGGIEGRYACWVRLIFAGGAICVSRIAQYGRLPALFVQKQIARSNGAAAPAVVDPLTASSLTQ